MTVHEAIAYCLGKPGAEETYPFDEETLVFKVAGKMFGLVYDKEGRQGLNLKCDPELSLVLRQQYNDLFPGYHMNKKHWNTVLFDGDVPDHEIFNLVDISYKIVVSKLKKAERERLQNEGI